MIIKIQATSTSYPVAEEMPHPRSCVLSSGHHSGGVACAALEFSESGLSCCWVTELQGGLTTSLGMVGYSGGVDAVGSWA